MAQVQQAGYGCAPSSRGRPLRRCVRSSSRTAPHMGSRSCPWSSSSCSSVKPRRPSPEVQLRREQGASALSDVDVPVIDSCALGFISNLMDEAVDEHADVVVDLDDPEGELVSSIFEPAITEDEEYLSACSDGDDQCDVWSLASDCSLLSQADMERDEYVRLDLAASVVSFACDTLGLEDEAGLHSGKDEDEEWEDAEEQSIEEVPCCDELAFDFTSVLLGEAMDKARITWEAQRVAHSKQVQQELACDTASRGLDADGSSEDTVRGMPCSFGLQVEEANAGTNDSNHACDAPAKDSEARATGKRSVPKLDIAAVLGERSVAPSSRHSSTSRTRRRIIGGVVRAPASKEGATRSRRKSMSDRRDEEVLQSDNMNSFDGNRSSQRLFRTYSATELPGTASKSQAQQESSPRNRLISKVGARLRSASMSAMLLDLGGVDEDKSGDGHSVSFTCVPFEPDTKPMTFKAKQMSEGFLPTLSSEKPAKSGAWSMSISKGTTDWPDFGLRHSSSVIF